MKALNASVSNNPPLRWLMPHQSDEVAEPFGRVKVALIKTRPIFDNPSNAQHPT